MQTWPFRNHTNDGLLEALHAARADEAGSTARLLRLLEEIDRRWLYAELGYTSLHQFCTEVLHLSESEAYLRITVARLCRTYPALFEMVERNQIHLTGAAMLAPHLTPENHLELLRAATHQTKRQIEKLLATRFPRPDILDSIRKYARVHIQPTTPAPPSSPTTPGSTAAGKPPQASASKAPAVQPLSLDRFAVKFTASARCAELIERARALSSHRRPGADLGELVEEALEALVDRLEKAKFKTTSQPRKAKPSANRERIPAAVKRAVHERDEARCSYVGPDGHRCGSRVLLEFDHRVALGLGGASTVENVRLLCRTHNQLAARRDFGEQQIELMTRGFRPVSRKSVGGEDGSSSGAPGVL